MKVLKNLYQVQMKSWKNNLFQNLTQNQQKYLVLSKIYVLLRRKKKFLVMFGIKFNKKLMLTGKTKISQKISYN